jgi:hypothetical protein
MLERRTRTRIRLIAAAIAASAQLLLAFTPFLESSAPDARAHIENAGTRLHHAHNEDTCAACVSQHIIATAEPSRAESFAVIASSSRPRVATIVADSRVPRFFTQSRAPPVFPV